MNVSLKTKKTTYNKQKQPQIISHWVKIKSMPTPEGYKTFDARIF